MDNLAIRPQGSNGFPNLVDALAQSNKEGRKFLDIASQQGISFRNPSSADIPTPRPQGHHAFWPSGQGDISKFLDSNPRPTAWFVEDRLIANRGHILTSVGGTGKTTLLYQLAVGAVIGHVPWDWKINSTGAALLILAEDDYESTHRFIAALSKELSDEHREAIRKNLRIFPMAGKSCVLLGNRGNRLVETDIARGLFELARSIPNLKFIGLDTAMALTEGRELEPTDQRRLGEIVDRLALETGACLLMTTHAAKSLRTQDELETHSSRGSGAITDVMRCEITLRTMTEREASKLGVSREERRGYVKVAITKSNSSPLNAYQPILLQRDEAGVFRGVDIDSLSNKPSQRALAALDALLEICTSDTGTSMKAWKEQCLSLKVISAGTTTAQDKSMQRLKAALKGFDLVRDGPKKGTYIPTSFQSESKLQ